MRRRVHRLLNGCFTESAPLSFHLLDFGFLLAPSNVTISGFLTELAIASRTRSEDRL